ncbi:hypothetical protein [Paludisphaera sp.]|uniref:hypothetical protein n=1 Tax=Paludisphaera sp. TaxID=2017432 RepID=UPI00301E19A2
MKIDEAENFDANVQMMQIIVGALTAGVVVFGVLVLTILDGGNRPAAANQPTILGLPLLTALALGFGVITLVASFVVPRLMVEGGLRAIAGGSTTDETKLTETGERQVYPANDVGRLLPLYQTQLIVASALNEGGAFFGLLAYLIEGNPAALATAGVLVAVLLSRFPVADRVRGWLDAHLERLAELRRDEFSTGP